MDWPYVVVTKIAAAATISSACPIVGMIRGIVTPVACSTSRVAARW
jgi:hypothetical protein